MPPATAARLKALSVEHEAAFNRASSETGYDATSEVHSQAIDEMERSYRSVFATEAPDNSALFFKLATLWGHDELDDAATVQGVLTRKHDLGLLHRFYVYRDAARLAGVNLATADLQAWDVDAFGTAFLAAGSRGPGTFGVRPRGSGQQ